MNEYEAFDEWFAKRDVWPRITYDEVWRAALAWLRSQDEPYTFIYELDTPLGVFRTLRIDDCNGRTPDRCIPVFLAPRPAIPDGWQSKASRDVLAERRRQVEAEGWTPEHDDAHVDGVLALAASGYAKAAAWATMTSDNTEHRYTDDEPPESWPDEWEFKPGSPRAMLVKAGALILAEIERLDRTSTAAPKPGESS